MFGFNWWKRNRQGTLAQLTIRELRDLVKSVNRDLEKNGTMTLSAQVHLAAVLGGMVQELADIRTANRLSTEADKALYNDITNGSLDRDGLSRALTLVMLAKRHPVLGWAVWTIANPFVRAHTKEVTAEVEEKLTRVGRTYER